MTTTTQQATRTCRCGLTITWVYLPGYSAARWMPAGSKRLGDSWCADGSLHKPGCPPSEVHDMIVTWDEVCAGDLVLWDGELCTVQWNLPFHNDLTQRLVMLGGGDMPGTIPCGTYAAVRRYDTGEG